MIIGTIFCGFKNAVAEESTDEDSRGSAASSTSIGITPVNKVLRLEPNTSYEDSFTVTNGGNTAMDFEVYAAPYSYVFSEDDDEYRLGFSHETAYTQIVRWITFKDTKGNYVEKPVFTVEPGGETKVTYRNSTPSSIPDGGQYAVLFAHTLSATVLSNGIKTEASPGLVLYGRSNGETINSAEISGLQINQSLNENGKISNAINASAKVKNTGNVDFMAHGKMKVTGLFGQVYYETPSTQGLLSIIPETELVASDKWEETPYFGFFNVTWTVDAAESTETITRTILIMPLPIIVFLILLLTIITIWIILMVRKRKERQSRFIA